MFCPRDKRGSSLAVFAVAAAAAAAAMKTIDGDHLIDFKRLQA